MNEILQGNSLDVLKTLPDQSVHCCVTSPPYFGLRDYGVNGQLGLEKTPEEYVANMVELFREVKRILRDDGTLWLNLGDSYAGNSKPGGGDPTIGKRNIGGSEYRKKTIPPGLKPKDLVGIPWMIAFALRADGWYLRSDIIWHKPNPMPESVTDRPTKSHEYIFLMSKSPKYYYDHEAIKEEGKQESISRYKYAFSGREGLIMPDGKNQQIAPKGMRNPTTKNAQYDGQKPNTMHLNREKGLKDADYMVRNKRTVWTVTTQPYSEAHFAVYPPKLIEPCILAGCPVGGIVLDPFFGSGTTGQVALENNRQYIGIELNPEYIHIAKKRLEYIQPVLNL